MSNTKFAIAALLILMVITGFILLRVPGFITMPVAFSLGWLLGRRS